ncbi:hypothetical protein [Acinetobacter baretiae]|uniref:hypothetical protein n=1 Tax=Acinetobacter baretiae TaxID=2605383 RepID=UPI0039A53F7F
MAIKQGKDTGASLTLDCLDIAKKFITLYWKQAVPFYLGFLTDLARSHGVADWAYTQAKTNDYIFGSLSN